jgi:type IV pilus assembly protein PilY1
VQPITHRPAVARHPYGGQMVLFGTGKFFSEDDNAVPDDAQVHSFYGIYDRDAALTGTRATLLQEQTILYQGASGDLDITEDVRLISDNSVDWNQKSGWYLDLQYLDVREGERVIDPPVLRTDRVVFTTLIPNDDECSTGGVSWLMELDYIDGGRLAYSVFDLDDDERFDVSDFIRVTLPSKSDPGQTETVTVSASAIFIPAIAKVPAFLSVGYKDVKYSSLSSGSLLDVDNRVDSSSGRQSWRQLR